MLMTLHGARRLRGHERGLFVAGALKLFNILDDCPEFETGVEPFDRIPEQDRSLVLLKVAGQLLDHRRAPVPTAWVEATVLAVHEFIREQLSEELDVAVERSGEEDVQEADCWWRSLILLAWFERCHDFREEYDSGTGPKQPVTSPDRREWDFKMDGLEEEVLDDRDCISEIVMELDQGADFRLSGEPRFPKGYYTTVAPSLCSDPGFWSTEIIELLERYYPDLHDEAPPDSPCREGAEVERGAAARRGA